tara:strand:+ start:2951 stop:3205 length:255 start_codon:yes stop_codon:yes gene_type:complete
MKKGQLKIETIKILKLIVKHINDSPIDYDSDNLKALLGEAMAYYDLYLLKKNNKKVEAQKLESMLVPGYEEGLRDRIRTYLDEH